MKKTLIIPILLALFSCQKEGKNTVTTTSTTTINTDSATSDLKIPNQIALETFAFPAEVDGCSCYFGKTKQEFENEKYVYIDDYGSTAYIHINGAEIKFPMKEGDFDPENFNKVLRNSEYTVTISGKKIAEKDEVMMFEGTMTVENNAGEKSITPIYGECGC